MHRTGLTYNIVTSEPLCIKTSRLTIREFRETDIEAIHSIANKPGFSYARLDGSYDASHAFVQRCITAQKTYDSGFRDNYKMAIASPLDDSLIGYVSIDDIQAAFPDNSSPASETSLSFFIDPLYAGNGYVSEAARALCDYCAKTHYLYALYATVHPNNIASKNILNALNFQYTGYIDNYATLSGHERRETYQLKTDQLNMTPRCKNAMKCPPPSSNPV